MADRTALDGEAVVRTSRLTARIDNNVIANGFQIYLIRSSSAQPAQEVRRLIAPRHHDVRAENIDLKRLGAVPAVSHERELRDFASLLLFENLGPRTLQSLALIAEVVHGTANCFTEPARTGGKQLSLF